MEKLIDNSGGLNIKIAFIGGGNITRALIAGLIKSNAKPKNIIVGEPVAAVREQLTKKFGITCIADNVACVAKSEVVVFAVKPNFMKTAVQSVAAVIKDNSPQVISVAAGIGCKDISSWGGGDKIVRAMPNTPAAVGAGFCGLFSAAASVAHLQTAEIIFKSVGAVIWVEREEFIDYLTGISASGPAFFFKFMEAFAATTEGYGFSAVQSQTLAAQTAFGAACLARNFLDGNKNSLNELRKQVATAGGTAQAGLKAMDKNNFDAAVAAGIKAAVARAENLSN